MGKMAGDTGVSKPLCAGPGVPFRYYLGGEGSPKSPETCTIARWDWPPRPDHRPDAGCRGDPDAKKGLLPVHGVSPGRSLGNTLYNLQIYNACRELLEEFGSDLEEVREQERDAPFGNGGLGRLAACFLDSMATLGIAGCAYGIYYDYGLFTQEIEDGYQREKPEPTWSGQSLGDRINLRRPAGPLRGADRTCGRSPRTLQPHVDGLEGCRRGPPTTYPSWAMAVTRQFPPLYKACGLVRIST
jgi:hypothetical protein